MQSVTTLFMLLIAIPFALSEPKALIQLEDNSFVDEENEGLLNSKVDANSLFLTTFQEGMGRDLQDLTFTCPGGSPTFYFTISIALTPQGGYDTSGCTTSTMQQIGIHLNSLLYNYGLGDAGEGDNAAYAAAVCTQPSTARRRLIIATYVWRGGGACRQCTTDNFDRRRLYDPNWFRNIYVPEMQNVLRNAIVHTVVSNYVSCLGSGPVVSVTVQEVNTESQVPTTCN
jgi:hypothetical protein